MTLTMDAPTPTPTASPTRRRNPAGGVTLLALKALVWLTALFNLFVFGWVSLAALKNTNEIFDGLFSLPPQWRFGNLAAAWQASNFDTAMANTVGLAISTAIATVLLAAPAAYALTRFGVRGSRLMTTAFVLGLGIPVQLIVLPLYSVMNSMRLVDSLLGLWMLYVATSLPFAVFFLTGFFGTLPREVEEAAAMDGASPARTFWQIMLPLARGGIVTLIILNVISHWSETVIAIVFVQSGRNETLPLALLKFLQRMQYTGADWGQLFAGVLIVLLPLLLLYIWLGRRIIEGLTLGAGK